MLSSHCRTVNRITLNDAAGFNSKPVSLAVGEQASIETVYLITMAAPQQMAEFVRTYVVSTGGMPHNPGDSDIVTVSSAKIEPVGALYKPRVKTFPVLLHGITAASVVKL